MSHKNISKKECSTGTMRGEYSQAAGYKFVKKKFKICMHKNSSLKFKKWHT